MIFAGIEGGATHSKLLLIKIDDDDGRIEKLVEEEGQSLNCVIQGAEFTCEYIGNWIKKIAENLKLFLPIDGIGLGLAGAGNTQISQKISEIFISKYSTLVKGCFVTTDAIAAVATAFENGGVVLIAGTGSACRYLSNEGQIYGVGGNGHLIEEAGGGFWIAQRAVQTIFNHEEGLALSEFPIQFLKDLIMKHFELKEFRDIFNIFYGPHFSKAFIASLCKKVAENAEKDPLCKSLLEEAGEKLARNLMAVFRNFDTEIVSVLLVGSVFQSWKILKIGFVKALQTTNSSKIKEISFFELTESAALGAAILAAKNSNVLIKFEFNTKKFVDSISIK